VLDQGELAAQRMVAARHQEVVVASAVEDDVGKAPVAGGTRDELPASEGDVEDPHLDQAIRGPPAEGRADPGADQRAHQQEHPAEVGVDHRAGRGPAHRPARDQLAPAEPEHEPGPLGEEVLVEEGERGLAALDPAVAVDRLDLVAGALLERAEAVLEAGQGLGPQGTLPALRGQLLFHAEIQHAGESAGDGAGGEPALPLPVVLQGADGELQRLAPLLAQLPERAQELDSLLELRHHRIEDAHHLEVLPEGGLPGSDVVGRADRIDQRHAGLAGPAKDLHLRLVFLAEGDGAVDHVEDSRALDDRTQKLALLGEHLLSAVGLDEPAHDFGMAIGGGLVPAHPVERAAGALEAGRVHQRIQLFAVDGHREAPAAGGGAGLGADRDRVVRGQRGDDARLPLVGVTDDGEGRRAHGAPPPGQPRTVRAGSRRSRIRFSQWTRSAAWGEASRPAS
jgi:hypothetical protein